MLREIQVERMRVQVFQSNAAMGVAAARDFAGIVRSAVAEQGETAVIFATGNSQLTFLTALQDQEIPWQQITAFHMDEYLGMPETHPASFRRFLQERLVEHFHPKAFYGMQGDAADVAGEIQRYTDLLAAHPPVICVMGIGENGHLAFNDPPAVFHARETVQVVTLDAVCRQQQVGEGHFPTLADVPTQALSLTIPALLKPPHVMALVPETRKAAVVKAALENAVTEDCPASILRTQAHARLYLDRDSAALLEVSP